MNKEEQDLGWFDGQWAPTNQLRIPLNDRGLKLSDGIFETLLVLQGQVKLLTDHLSRWHQSASLLGLSPPPSQLWLSPLIQEIIERAGLNSGNGRLRLNWSRGSQSDQGIQLAKHNQYSNHRFWMEIKAEDPSFHSLTAMVSRHERRNEYSQLSFCKTFAYGQSIKARQEAKASGFDEALLLNTKGELCCGTAANLLIKRHGQWITPHLNSGCLPGVMRQKGIEIGLIKEAKIQQSPETGDEWLLINSLGCWPIKKLMTLELKTTSNPKDLWLSLLK